MSIEEKSFIADLLQHRFGNIYDWYSSMLPFPFPFRFIISFYIFFFKNTRWVWWLYYTCIIGIYFDILFWKNKKLLKNNFYDTGILYKKGNGLNFNPFPFFGGDEGSWTPVRKRTHRAFSERRLCFISFQLITQTRWAETIPLKFPGRRRKKAPRYPGLMTPFHSSREQSEWG